MKNKFNIQIELILITIAQLVLWLFVSEDLMNHSDKVIMSGVIVIFIYMPKGVKVFFDKFIITKTEGKI